MGGFKVAWGKVEEGTTSHENVIVEVKVNPSDLKKQTTQTYLMLSPPYQPNMFTWFKSEY